MKKITFLFVFVVDGNSLVRYLHPSDEELKALIGKNAVTTSNKGKGRKAATTDSRYVCSSLG